MCKITVAVATEGPNGELCFGSSPVGVSYDHPPHRQVVSKVQVTLIRVPKSTPHVGQLSSTVSRTDPALLSPLSVVSITVALKLWVGAALVDGAAAQLDLPEGSSPVIMADVITTNPIAKWSPVWFYTTYRVINEPVSCTHARTHMHAGRSNLLGVLRRRDL